MDPESTKTPKTRAKNTFLVHDPQSMKVLAKLTSADYRYAALKCASRKDKLPETAKNPDGSAKIWLRKTNTRIFREYKGDVVPLDSPQEVNRSGRTIVYTKRPVVSFVRTWIDGVDDDGHKRLFDGPIAPPTTSPDTPNT